MGDLSSSFPAILLLGSLLLGSIPFGVLVARAFKVSDLTNQGSGNIGATNVTRVLGWKAGLITLLLDLGKGSLAAALASELGIGLWSRIDQLSYLQYSQTLQWTCGLCAVLGHCFSPWLKFKGGKGVATGFGVVLVLSPWAALAGAFAYIVTFASRKMGSLASIAGLFAAAVAHLVLHSGGAHLWAGAALIFVVLLRHEGNIDALLENRERSF